MHDLHLREVSKSHFNLLLHTVKMLSSVSLINEPSAKIVNKIANPYYVRTLLQLLMQVSTKQKAIILSVVSDLTKLKLNLQLEEAPLLPIKLKMGSWLTDFLYSYAH